MIKNARSLSVAAFSFSFAYLLSFLFEGQVLYEIIGYYGTKSNSYILIAIVAHFAGLLTCGFFVRSLKSAKSIMTGSLLVSLLLTAFFFFGPTILWFIGLILAGYASGCAVASWGYFLKTFTPKNDRIKSCADVLIYSNIIMIVVNVVAMNLSPFLGLSLSMLCLTVSIVLIWMLPVNVENAGREEMDRPQVKIEKHIKKPLAFLFLFIFVITINSGLMYQVINPSFEHLVGIVSWYWAVPYIIALAVMRNLPMKANRSKILYVGMGMIIGAFISFMLLGKTVSDYLIVDTLMLGACGIFDLFWWSILGEMLDYTCNPVRTFGIGLSANVSGVLCGDVLGMTVTSIQLSGAEVAVIAITVICITLVILPPLNHQLILLLKNHAYLTAYERMNENQQTAILHKVRTLDPLTPREKEVLQFILSGKSNREIAIELFISESTVKTHARNIYSKYDVGSRAELISTILKNQSEP